MKINKNCGEGTPFESDHRMDSHHMILFSTLPSCKMLSFVRSFVQRHESALRMLSQMKTYGESNRQRNTPIPPQEKMKQHNMTKIGIGFFGQAEASNPLFHSWVWPACCKYSCDTVVKSRSCAAPFVGFPDIIGLVCLIKAFCLQKSRKICKAAIVLWFWTKLFQWQ